MGCNIDFSKWRPNILHEMKYLVFHNYNVFFGKKKYFLFSGLISFLYLCLLPSSATVKMDNGENVMKNIVMQGMMTLLDHKSNEKQKHKQQN
jgi:hypothetical protein